MIWRVEETRNTIPLTILLAEVEELADLAGTLGAQAAGVGGIWLS